MFQDRLLAGNASSTTTVSSPSLSSATSSSNKTLSAATISVVEQDLVDSALGGDASLQIVAMMNNEL